MTQVIVVPPLYAYLFFVPGEKFYIMEYPGDEAAQRGAEINKDTLRVETWDGRVIWKATIQ